MGADTASRESLQGFGELRTSLVRASQEIMVEILREGGGPSWSLRMPWARRAKLRLLLAEAQDRLSASDGVAFDDEGCAELARVSIGHTAELMVVMLEQADERAFALWRRELTQGEWAWTPDVLVVPEALAATLCDRLSAAIDRIEARHRSVPAPRMRRARPVRLAIHLGRRPSGLLRALSWLGGHLLSFEAAFVLFLYSNELKTVVRFPFPLDETLIFAALAAGAGALVIYREGIYLRGVPILVAALLFVFWVVASVTWSPSRSLARVDAGYLLSFTMFSVAAGCLIIANRRERAMRFFLFVLLIATGMAVYGLYIYFSYGDFRRWAGWKDVDARVYLAFGHTVVNGAGIAFCIAIFSRFASLRQTVGAAIFAAGALFLLVGGGRGPFLGVVVAALVGLATRPPTIRPDRIEVPYATLVALVLVTVGTAYVGYALLTDQTTRTLQRFTQIAEQAENTGMLGTSHRLYYWAAAYGHFLTAPLIGHGLRSFSVLQNKGNEADGSHPHNIILQILAETGIVGLVLFALFIWIAVRHASFARLQRDPLLVCALLFLITSSMSPLFGRDLAGVRKFFFAASLLALRPPASAPAPAGGQATSRGQSRPIRHTVAGRLASEAW